MKQRFLFMGLLLASALSYAECSLDQAQIFSCTTVAGKSIQVCQDHNVVEYSYGKIGAKPEIVVKQPKKALELWQSVELIAKNTYTALTIPNGQTKYMVYYSTNAKSGQRDSGVSVQINDQEASTVKCAGNVRLRILSA